MTRLSLVLIAAGGSAALLAAAFIFQAFGYLPCAMCLWQRWPHAAAVLIGAAALAIPGRALPIMGALAAAVTSGIGFYHAGVEYRWWPGPSSCTGGGGGSLAGDLLATDGPRLVLCDQATMLGPISMAGWNGLLSLALVVVWIMAAKASDGRRS